MPIGAIAGAVIGGMFSNSASKRAANAELEAARMQADAAKFKPYNVTGLLGSANFDTNNNTVSTSIDPRLKARQDELLRLGGSAMPSDVNPDNLASNLFSRYQALAAPYRERDFAMLNNSQFNNGTLGLSYGATASGLGASNPALEAWLNSQNLADQKMFLDAETNARQFIDNDLARSQGMFNSAIGLDAVGADALNAGINIGSKAGAAASASATALANGMRNANTINYKNDMNLINSMTKGFTEFAGNGGFDNIGNFFSGGGNTTVSENAPAWMNNSSSYSYKF